MNLQLEDLVQQLTGEAQLASAGKFTVDVRQATSRLQVLALENPYFYVLKLVQSAVSSRAESIRIDSRQGRVTVMFAGGLIQAKPLAELLSQSLQYGLTASQPLCWLASGLASAVGIGARKIEVKCWDGTQGFQQEWVSGSTRQRPWEKPGRACLEFRVERQLRQQLEGSWAALRHDLLDLLMGSRRAMTREAAVVYDRCPYAPIGVILNGRKVNHAVFGAPRGPGYDRLWAPRKYVQGSCHRRHHLVERHTAATEPVNTFLAPPVCHATRFQGPETATPLHAMIALEMSLQPQARVTWLQDGVTLLEESHSWGIPGLVAVLSTHGIHTDLSGFKLIHDQAYRDRLDWLRSQASDMAREVREHLDEMPLPQVVKSALAPRT